MYSSCMFCHASLGKNETIEHFPIGRRLAFDPAKGRLWVVCGKCERWNLTPIEERWEAIDECERVFSRTKTRMSTDNVGLARAPDGLDLVRIGKPMRPEFAAWRYGDQFGRRMRKQLLLTGGVGAIGIAAGVAGPMVGGVVGLAVSAIQLVSSGHRLYSDRARQIQVVNDDADVLRLSRLDLQRLAISGRAGRWVLALWPKQGTEPVATFEGHAALRAAAAFLPAMNCLGGGRKDVGRAVALIEELRDPNALFLAATRRRWVVDRLRNRWTLEERKSTTDGVWLKDVGGPTLLALEMATHEDIERRAVEGELAMLEAAWKEADEIAAIADNLTASDRQLGDGDR